MGTNKGQEPPTQHAKLPAVAQNTCTAGRKNCNGVIKYGRECISCRRHIQNSIAAAKYRTKLRAENNQLAARLQQAVAIIAEQMWQIYILESQIAMLTNSLISNQTTTAAGYLPQTLNSGGDSNAIASANYRRKLRDENNQLAARLQQAEGIIAKQMWQIHTLQGQIAMLTNPLISNQTTIAAGYLPQMLDSRGYSNAMACAFCGVLTATPYVLPDKGWVCYVTCYNCL